MSDTFIDTPAQPARDRNQLVAAVILGVAAVMTALAAYNAALADGDALQGYTTSTRSLNDANAFYAQGNTTAAADQSIFVAFATAKEGGNENLAGYLTTLMRPELVRAIEWWDRTDAAVTPFDDLEGNPYEVSDFEEAHALEDLAKQQFEDGADADDRGDLFELAAVFFALTLFFGGIATLFDRPSVTVALLVLAGVAVVAGGVNLARAV